MNHLSPYERLVSKLFPGSRLLHAWPLTGGISAETTALEITGPDGQARRWIVRRPVEATLQHNPRAAEEEYRLLQALHALGLAVPAPYALDRSGEVFTAPYLVMEFIDGQPDYAPVRPLDFARQAAEQLARIHAVDRSRADLSFLSEQKVEPAIHQPLGSTALEVESVRAALAAAWPFPRHNAATLLHGDYWPGNLLWQAGRLAAVIDWEDAALGDPLADLAITRLDLLWIYGREVMETFTRHYLAQATIDPRSLPYWDLCAALRLARLVGDDLPGWAAFFQPYGRDDITGESIRGYFNDFVEQALSRLLVD